MTETNKGDYTVTETITCPPHNYFPVAKIARTIVVCGMCGDVFDPFDKLSVKPDDAQTTTRPTGVQK